MLKFRGIAAWLAELVLECLLGAYILLLVFGSNGEGESTIDNIWQNTGFTLLFVIYSGYFATTAWVNIVRTPKSVLVHLWVKILLFLIHAGCFLALFGIAIERTISILILGVAVVAFASLVGASVRVWGSKEAPC
jgi:hypothetical protein